MLLTTKPSFHPLLAFLKTRRSLQPTLALESLFNVDWPRTHRHPPASRTGSSPKEKAAEITHTQLRDHSHFPDTPVTLSRPCPRLARRHFPFPSFHLPRCPSLLDLLNTHLLGSQEIPFPAGLTELWRHKVVHWILCPQSQPPPTPSLEFRFSQEPPLSTTRGRGRGLGVWETLWSYKARTNGGGSKVWVRVGSCDPLQSS